MSAETDQQNGFDLPLSTTEAAFVVELLGDAIQFDVAGTPLNPTERQMAATISSRLGNAIGMSPTELSPAHRLTLDSASTGHMRVVHSVEGILGILVTMIVVLIGLILLGALIVGFVSVAFTSALSQ